jgi:homoserine/homoserine lactone efflux protein
MSAKVWTIFLLMETLQCLRPGPAVLFVLSQGLARGARASTWASCGILAGNAIYFLLSATSIAAVLIGSRNIFDLITWVGAGYTVWLGVRMFVSSGTGLSLASSTAPAVASSRIFGGGFLLQISNPGAIIFFVAVLPQFIIPGHSVARQVLILAVTSIAVEFVVLSLYGMLAAQLGKVSVQPWLVKVANRLAGVMLLVAAVALAKSRL